MIIYNRTLGFLYASYLHTTVSVLCSSLLSKCIWRKGGELASTSLLADRTKVNFHGEALGHPAPPLLLGKAEFTEVFILTGRGNGETTCPQVVSGWLWQLGRAVWWRGRGEEMEGINGAVVSEQGFSTALKAFYNNWCHLCPEIQSSSQLSSREFRKTSI